MQLDSFPALVLQKGKEDNADYYERKAIGSLNERMILFEGLDWK